MRYFLDISYNGSNYHGWQVQTNANSVQETIESAISKILTSSIQITGSGRTDTGVHAIQQVAHFDNNKSFDTAQLVYQLNSMLPWDISINNCYLVPDEAHARFDAVERAYKYFIHQKKDPFVHGQSYYFKPVLDVQAIEKACEILKECEDFESFSKVKTDVTNFKCQILETGWEQTDQGYVFTISANRFLRGMVRAIVGTLIDVGQKKLTLQQFKKILEAKDRSEAGTNVPAQGLFLSRVVYPKEYYPKQ